MTSNNMIQLYTWSNPHEGIHTQWGTLTVKDWLTNEYTRITKDPTRHAEIRTNASGQVSLFVNQVAGEYDGSTD